MKNIIKYVFVFFGLLFLASFFFVEKTYGYIPCSESCSDLNCECGCGYASGCPYCKQCICPTSCACGCVNSYTKQCYDPNPPTNCNCGYSQPSTCAYVCNPCSCSVSCVTSCNTTTGVCKCKSGCVTSGCNSDGSCRCSPTCLNNCNSDGSCPTSGGLNCNLFTCDAGFHSIYDSSADGCICVKNPGTCATGSPCGGTTENPTCCPPGTYCGQTTSGSKICVKYGDPPVPPSNTAPTSPTGLQVEGASNPQNVTDTTPEFSAIFNDPDTGDSSVYYQIQVNTKSDFTGTVMWNSGKTSMTRTNNGSRSSQISYAGTAFPQVAKKIYYWRIKFWDAEGLESPWSSGSPWFIMCINIDCDPTQYCESAGWSPTRLTDESILLEDVVKCTAMVNCQSVTKHGDCYEDPGIECTKDTDCDPGECCRAYICTTDCGPAIECSKDTDCGIGKCCKRNQCGECMTPDTQSLRVIMGNKISDTITVSLWDRILALFRKLNMYFY